MGPSRFACTLLEGQSGIVLTPCQELLSSAGWGCLSSLAHMPSPIPLPRSGRQYWEYEFQQQPSQEECEGSSLSTVFEHFALLQRDSWETFFELLFWNRPSGMEGGQISLSPTGIPQVGAGHSWPEGAVIAELQIKSCLLRPDFVSVDFWGEVHPIPHLGLCLAQPRAQLAGGGAVAEAKWGGMR